MICNFCHVEVTRIQSLILVGSASLEIFPEMNLIAKITKVAKFCHGATKRMKTTNMTRLEKS